MMRAFNVRHAASALFISILAVSLFSLFYVIELRKRAAEAVDRNLAASAAELIRNVELDLKLNNMVDVFAALRGSFLKNQVEFISLKSLHSNRHVSFPDLEREYSADDCRFQHRSVPVAYAGEEIGALEYCYDLDRFEIRQIPVYALTFIFLAVFCLSAVIFLWVRALTREYNLLIQYLDSIDLEQFDFHPGVRPNFKESNLRAILGKLDKLLGELRGSRDQKVEVERHRAQVKIASQVAHDIRSPLAALRVFDRAEAGIDQDHRALLRGSIRQINDIANNLLSSYSENRNGEEEGLSKVMVVGIVDQIVSQRRAQYADRDIDIMFDSAEAAYGLFVAVNSSQFRRVLSNLIGNAVESIPASRSGRVRIEVFGSEKGVSVSVIDNGCGIAASAIERVFERGVSIGKPSGSGLGLSHAKEMVESWGGEISAASNLEEGTRMMITLSASAPAPWFVPRIAIEPGDLIVAIDDDEALHRLWGRRLPSGSNGVSLRVFKSVSEFASSEVMAGAGPKLFLLDLELTGSDETGLDLIESLEIADRSILVTGMYDVPEVVDRCLKGGIRLIPKHMAEWVPIEVVRL